MKIIGHRGARGLAPENTLASIQKAIEHHVNEVEIDVRVTKDGVPILHHDPFLTDPDGSEHELEEHRFEELKQRKPDLATLDEALAAFDIPFYVEIKPDEPVKPIVKIIEKHPTKQLKLASFSQQTLLELQRALPEIDKIVIEKWSGVRATRHARQLGTRYISMNQKWLWRGFIRQISKRYMLYAYTMNDPKKAAKWAKYGLYAVVTDYPDSFER